MIYGEEWHVGAQRLSSCTLRRLQIQQQICIVVSSSTQICRYVCFPLAANFALLAGLIKGINEVEDMLKYNIAQARLNERGNYGK